MCDKSGNPPTWPQLEHAIRRNFGGLDEATLNPLEEFKKNLPCIREPFNVTQVSPEVNFHDHLITLHTVLIEQKLIAESSDEPRLLKARTDQNQPQFYRKNMAWVS